MCATHCEFSKKLENVKLSELPNCTMLNEHNVVLCCNRRWGYFLTELFFVCLVVVFFFLAWVCFSSPLDWLHLNTKLGFAEQFIEATLRCTETSQTVVGLSPGRRDFSASIVHFTSKLWLSCCLPFIMPLFLRARNFVSYKKRMLPRLWAEKGVDMVSMELDSSFITEG